jgi:uncharacterized membrane protein YtjA (UPF0391 family)
MLRWVAVFLGGALVAGVFGFVVFAGVVANIAKLLFLTFLGLVAITLVMLLMRGDGEELEE